MNKYKVTITEILEKTVDIEADNERQAYQIADDKYRASAEDFVLSADNLTCVYFGVEISE